MLAHPSLWQLSSLFTGLAALAILFVFGKTRFAIFGAIVALVVPTMAVILLGLDDVERVSHVGAIPSGLPLPGLPRLSLLTPSLIAGALAVAAIVLVQGAGVAESAPNLDGSFANANQDFIAQGVGNLAAGVFKGQPVGGSVGQTALNVAAGRAVALGVDLQRDLDDPDPARLLGRGRQGRPPHLGGGADLCRHRRDPPRPDPHDPAHGPDLADRGHHDVPRHPVPPGDGRGRRRGGAVAALAAQPGGARPGGGRDGAARRWPGGGAAGAGDAAQRRGHRARRLRQPVLRRRPHAAVTAARSHRHPGARCGPAAAGTVDVRRHVLRDPGRLRQAHRRCRWDARVVGRGGGRGGAVATHPRPATPAGTHRCSRRRRCSASRRWLPTRKRSGG